MKKCKIGGVTFKFKNRFTELTLQQTKLYLMGLEEYETHYQSYQAALDQDIFNQASFDEASEGILLTKLKILTVLDTRGKFGLWFLKAKGIDPEDVHYIFEEVTKTIKDFTGFWNSLPPVDEFSFGFWTRYKVHEMKGYSVQRSMAIATLTNSIFTIKKELDAGSYNNIVKLVAYIVRPTKVELDAGVAKRAFFRYARGMTDQERYEYYLIHLDEYVSKQIKKFQDLSAATAIGVIKAYFAKKKEQ